MNPAGKLALPRASPRASDPDPAVLEGLPQGLQRVPAKLGELVEVEHAVAGETDLPGAEDAATAGETDARRTVVRRAERSPCDQPTGQARRAPHLGNLERFSEIEGRKDARKTTGQHALARTRWTAEQQVVTACRGELQGTSRRGLSPDLAEVGSPVAPPSSVEHRGAVQTMNGRREPLREGHRVGQGGDRNHLEVVDQGGLVGVASRHHDPRATRLTGRQGDRQHPADRTQGAGKRELSHQHRAVRREPGDLLIGHQDRGGDREVETRALLAYLGGGEVDDHAALRKLEPRVGKGGADAIDTFSRRGVGKTDRHYGGQPPAQIDLDLDEMGLDPHQDGACGASQHGVDS